MVERFKQAGGNSRAYCRRNDLLVALTYFIAGKMGATLPGHEFISYWLGAWYFGIIGAPLAILVHIVVARMTPETPIEIRKFLIEKVHSQ